MRLDSETLARLRDALRGGVAHPPPVPDGAEALPGDGSPEMRAIAARIAPLCEVLYLLSVADHRHDARERAVMAGAIGALTEGALGEAAIERMIAGFEAALAAEGWESRLARSAGVLAADRRDAEAAFTLAAVMAIADEFPDERERVLLEELRAQLGISARRAQVLLGEAVSQLPPAPA